MTLIDAIGFLAAGLVLLTFSMKTLLTLRLVAIASNLAFIAYAAAVGLTPILTLHLLLLPLNVFRTWEQIRLLQRIDRALKMAPEIDLLLPYMVPCQMEKGAVVFHRGDPADCLYYIASGAVELPELHKKLETGSIFGELGLFTPDRTRTASAVMAQAGQICSIGGDTIMKLYHSHPSFGLVLTRLVAERMAENEADLRADLAKVRSALAAGTQVLALNQIETPDQVG